MSKSDAQVEISPEPRALPIATSATTVIPNRFYATFTFPDRPYRVWLDIRTSPSTGPTVYDLRVQHSLTAPGGITTELLRSIPMRDLRRMAVEAASRPITEWGTVETVGVQRRVFRSDQSNWTVGAVGGPGRGRRISDEFLQRVADVYRDAMAAGRPPVAAIVGELHAERSTAGRWVMLARQRGFLGPAKGTMAGEVVGKKKGKGKR